MYEHTYRRTYEHTYILTKHNTIFLLHSRVKIGSTNPNSLEARHTKFIHLNRQFDIATASLGSKKDNLNIQINSPDQGYIPGSKKW